MSVNELILKLLILQDDGLGSNDVVTSTCWGNWIVSEAEVIQDTEVCNSTTARRVSKAVRIL